MKSGAHTIIEPIASPNVVFDLDRSPNVAPIAIASISPKILNMACIIIATHIELFRITHAAKNTPKNVEKINCVSPDER